LSTLFFSLAIWLGIALAGPGQGSFDVGVVAARRGDHVQAESGFRDALAAGAFDPAVYHGLGNALYRQGKRGPAIAAWRRALALDPNHPDVAANLDRARHESEDRIEQTANPGIFFWQTWLAPNVILYAGSGAVSLGLWWLLLCRIRRLPISPLAVVVPIGIGALFLASTLQSQSAPQGGVVVVPQVAARSALGPVGVDLFVLHAGAEVTILEEDGEHVLISLPDARKGWMASSVLLSTDPRTPFGGVDG